MVKERFGGQPGYRGPCLKKSVRGQARREEGRERGRRIELHVRCMQLSSSPASLLSDDELQFTQDKGNAFMWEYGWAAYEWALYLEYG